MMEKFNYYSLDGHTTQLFVVAADQTGTQLRNLSIVTKVSYTPDVKHINFPKLDLFERCEHR